MGALRAHRFLPGGDRLGITSDRNARIYKVDDQLVCGRLLPLFNRLVESVYNIGIHNIFRVIRIYRGHAERALRQSLETDSSCLPAFS